MKPASTVQLRLRGLPWPHLVMSAVAVVPIARILWAIVVEHLPYATRAPGLTALSAAVALVPWLRLLAVKASVRAKCDDVAVHAGGEALPYKTIRELRVERTGRRTVLHLVRSEDIQLRLVLWDAFAGRLEPLAILRERLAAHHLTFDDPI